MSLSVQNLIADRPAYPVIHMFAATTVFCISLFWASAASAEIYKIIDKDGNVIFTDVPPKDNPEAYNVDPGSSYTPLPSEASGDTPQSPIETTDGQLGANFDNPDDPATPEPLPAYTAIHFSFPAEDQAIRENSGTVTFRVDINPILHSNHRLQITLDGLVVPDATSQTFTIEHMDRGTHVLQASIVDGQGAVLLSSAPRTFHLLRHSVRN